MPALNITLATPASNALASTNSLKDSKSLSTSTAQTTSFNHYLKSQTESTGTNETSSQNSDKVNSNSQEETSSDASYIVGVIQTNIKQLLAKLKENGSETETSSQNSEQQTLIGQLETLLGQLNQPSVSNFLGTDQGKQLIEKLKETLQKGSSSKNDVSSDPLMASLLTVLQQLTLQSSSKDAKTATSQEPGVALFQSGHSTEKTAANILNLNRSNGQADPASSQPNANLKASFASLKQPSMSVQNTQNQLVQSDSGGQQLVGKLTSDSGKSSQSGTDQNNNQSLGTLLYGGTGMGKVQQFIFHSQTNAAPVSQPSEQILNQIQRMVNQGALKNSDGQLSVQLQLHPENLGTVQIGLTQTDDGLIATITTHSPLTKDLIDGQLSHLEQTLSASGITVNKLEVNVADSSQQGAQDSPYQQAKDQQQNNGGYRQPQAQDSSTGDQESSDDDPFQNWLNEVNKL